MFYFYKLMVVFHANGQNHGLRPRTIFHPHTYIFLLKTRFRKKMDEKMYDVINNSFARSREILSAVYKTITSIIPQSLDEKKMVTRQLF